MFKLILIVTFSSLFLGVASGLFIRLFRQDHPHIVFPIYLITGVLSGISGLAISLIASAVYSIINNPDIYTVIIICSIFILIANIILVIKIITSTK